MACEKEIKQRRKNMEGDDDERGHGCKQLTIMWEHWHWRHEPISVTCKTLTKSSTFVKFVIKFVGITNLTNILNIREPLNNWPYNYG